MLATGKLMQKFFWKIDALKIIERDAKMMDPNLIGYYIIDYAVPSKITTEYHYQINFGNRNARLHISSSFNFLSSEWTCTVSVNLAEG